MILDKKISNRTLKDDFADKNELMDYLKEKAKNHSWYKYYSKRQYIENILNSNSVFLSDGANWNDKTDKDSFMDKSNGYTNFGLCLSFSKSENVSMWMLYSGNDGLMIDYNKATIKSIEDANSIELGYFKGNKFESVKSINKEDNNYKIVRADIIYYGDGETSNTYYVKRSDEAKKDFSGNIIDDITLLKKKTAWSYENETRIIVSVRNDLISDGITTVKIRFPAENIEELRKRTYDSPNAIEKRYSDSKFKDKINWDLCKNCKKICLASECDIRTLEEEGK